MTDDIERELQEMDAALAAAPASAPTAEQGSPAWLAERVGHCTASRFKDVMDFLKSGKEGAKRAGYRMELVVERLTGSATEHYVNDFMAWGTENEPMAIMAYEAHTGAMVARKGFIHHPTVPMCGGSVDGLVGEDGIIEIKCPATGTHIKTLLGAECEHLPQIQGYLWIIGRKWCDFISYDPRLPDGLQLYIQRIARDDDYVSELAGNVFQFLAEVDELHQRLLKIAGPQAVQAPEDSRAPADSAFDLATQA